MGRCGECQAWGSVAEAGPRPARTARPARSPPPRCRSARCRSRTPGPHQRGARARPGARRRPLVPGAAVLLAGEPGVGKSTLLLEVAAQTARSGCRTLYVTGEESASQVRLRADRTRGVHPDLYLAAETDLGAVLTHVHEVRPQLLVIDSVQTIGAADVEGVPGGVTQVRRSPRPWSGSPRAQNIAPSWSATSPRTARSPGRGCSSTSSTWSCSSRASGLAAAHGPGGEEPLRPGRRGRLLRPVRRVASSRSPTRPGCSSPGTTSRWPAPASRCARGPPADPGRGPGAGHPSAPPSGRAARPPGWTPRAPR